MDLLYLEIAFLIISLILYFSYGAVQFVVGTTFEKYRNDDLTRSTFFYLFIICVELTLTYITMSSRCSNISAIVIIYPMVIWLFIFLATKAVLIINPGFKSAFSDTIGYWCTFGQKQNALLNDLLDKNTSEKEKDVVIKIISDKGLLFNSIVPGNFNEIWTDLKSMSNKTLYDQGEQTIIENGKQVLVPSTEQQFLNWAVQRDHIGELCWMMWSGILCISITSLYANSFPCQLTAKQMQENKVESDKVTREMVYPDENYLTTN